MSSSLCFMFRFQHELTVSAGITHTLLPSSLEGLVWVSCCGQSASWFVDDVHPRFSSCHWVGVRFAYDRWSSCSVLLAPWPLTCRYCISQPKSKDDGAFKMLTLLHFHCNRSYATIQEPSGLHGCPWARHCEALLAPQYLKLPVHFKIKQTWT